ncbi:MAG: hypothetical protein QOG42_12 [Solirubrobacteraceae bacterium]|nr:hypothetical protein [Solirubrobacteraceae bacterium]
MPSWNRDSDRALDGELRAARPEPSAAVTQAIADRVRPRQTAGKHRFGRLHLALAGGLTALVLTPVVATGFGGIGSLGKTTKASTKSSAALKSKARSGSALGALSANSNRARKSSSRAGSRPAAAGMAAGSGQSLASLNSAGAFFGDVFQPQNDFQATQDEYALECDIGSLIQTNDATLTQGGNTATGGSATSTGGAGGNASTGNTQTNTGGSTAADGGNTQSFGGDTEATSGNATGGNGGNATATGGDAVAANVASQTLINVACVPGG